MQIEISEADIRKLEWLARELYTAKGSPVTPVTQVLHRMIDDEYDRANPYIYRAIQERGD